MGGVGTERKISLQSGRCVVKALAETPVDVVACDISPDDLTILDDSSVDVFFIALHGEFGEDGRLQQILEDRALVYTGSGPQASALAMDKLASKKFFAEMCVATPLAVQFDGRIDIAKLESRLQRFRDRYVVKPVRAGSSVGITIVENSTDAIKAANLCLNQFGNCMIEEFIAGAEITVGILVDKALLIIEVRSKTGFYDYHAKYVDEATEYIFDTIDDSSLVKEIENAALACFNCLGCRDFARVDFILGTDGLVYALEVNTIPGFTSHSLLPKAAAKTGISMSDLCMRILNAALQNVRVETS